MNSTSTRSDRIRLGLSLAVFGIAGVANTTLETTLQSVVAGGLAVVGVYGVATYARSVSRPHLTHLSVVLWVGFFAVTAGHVVGLETIAGLAPATIPTALTIATLEAVTWATLLGAGASTAFLGFREYNARSSADVPEEQVLDQDLDL